MSSLRRLRTWRRLFRAFPRLLCGSEMICTYLTKYFSCSCMVKCANYNVCFLLLKKEKQYSVINNFFHANKRRKMKNVAIHTDVIKASSSVGWLPDEPKVVVENLTFKILTATAGSCVNPSFATILVPLFSRLSASSLLIFKKKQRQRKIKNPLITEINKFSKRSNTEYRSHLGIVRECFVNQTNLILPSKMLDKT